jgi:signal transduction histidine kinase
LSNTIARISSSAASGAAAIDTEDTPTNEMERRPRALPRGSHRAPRGAMEPSHVLFVDDSESNLVVWEAGCESQFKVLVANGAEPALELIRSHEVGVVVADQRMPGMTGIELLERIREESPDTIRILITAYSDLDASIDAINRGQVRRYLRKPCSLPELRVEIADAFDLYALRRTVREAEKRLLLTERVYALGVVAAGLGKELGRPASAIVQSVISSRTELRALATKVADGSPVDPRALHTKLLQVDEYLEGAQRSVERVLDIARSVEAPAPVDDESVELSEVLRVALKVVRGEIRRGTDVKLDIRPVPPVRGTAAKLGQVALNLLVNAIDAVAARPPEDRHIVVRLLEQGPAVRFEVADNGASIPEADLDKLFDPLHAGTCARSSGLGLAISRAIVEEAGGTLSLVNQPGGGVVFRVTLPRFDADG